MEQSKNNNTDDFWMSDNELARIAWKSKEDHSGKKPVKKTNNKKPVAKKYDKDRRLYPHGYSPDKCKQDDNYDRVILDFLKINELLLLSETACTIFLYLVTYIDEKNLTYFNDYVLYPPLLERSKNDIDSAIKELINAGIIRPTKNSCYFWMNPSFAVKKKVKHMGNEKGKVFFDKDKVPTASSKLDKNKKDESSNKDKKYLKQYNMFGGIDLIEEGI